MTGIKIAFSWLATVLAAAVISLPLMYRSARGALSQVDKGMLEAARSLGMTEWRIFWRSHLPNALRAIPAVLVLLVLLAVMQRIHPREKYSAEEKRALLRGGFVCGAFLALAINLQQFGMGTTSAGKAGFITATV